MRNCKIYKQLTVGLACGLMMVITTTAIAGSPVSQYSLRVTDEQSNPWASPHTPNSATGFQQIPKSREQQYQSRQIEKHKRGFRFVTPEILESLKQQQTQTQLMPENKQRPLMPRQSIQNYGYPPGFQQTPKTRRPQYQDRQIEKHKRGFRFVTPETLESLKQQQIQTQLMTENNQRPLIPRQPVQNYGYPPSGTGFTNPLYDTPAVSPWSSGSDILHGGESSPFVPKEAIGGLSPFHIPPFADNNGVYESGNTNILKETNVFNPFNFGYYRNSP
jgi:hypothetical protein